MLIVGLTGSIGMGKTTTASMFRARGVAVHDADAAVARLYAGRALPHVGEAFPTVIVSGAIDRARLAAEVVGSPENLAALEAIVHPLVREEEARFVAARRAEGRRLVVLDVPLLFEAGGIDRIDVTVVVTAPADVQRARVMARPGMTAQKFESLLARQIPDRDKRKRAHFLVETGDGLATARRNVDAILRALSAMQ